MKVPNCFILLQPQYDVKIILGHEYANLLHPFAASV